jgi:hypothetical protein
MIVRSFALLLVFSISSTCTEKKITLPWPDAPRETRPWTRWWWHGSSLTKEGITAELQAYRKAGLGGVEITPIYGVRGQEDKFIPYLSDEWMDLLIHTLAEAERLDMGVDMATGTGWPFGGPWVNDEFACRNVFNRVYDLSQGQTLKDKIEYIQPPFIRTVNPAQIDVKQLVQPVEKNNSLQELAIDQVQFERSLPLVVLMGYGDQGEVVNLTDKVSSEGKLGWSPPSGKWKLYALFMGWHGKMVERAGPGGEGNVIDHFSGDALQHYLNRFDSALSERDITSLRAFFNDSYEVDDARGAADWTPRLLSEFKQRRGYDLSNHLPALFGSPDESINRRVLYDYRLTISELVLDEFTSKWSSWASKKNAITRNQAHGSPANILDLYAVVDIPEIEGTDPLRIRMASSAGNVTGKKLVSSESATWLDEHFESDLGEIKSAVDLFLLNGVNHIFYHGTTYSPPGEPWPGWLFYAAVHLNPRNPQWADFDVLNKYVSRCQSWLQATRAKNDVLLYYPIADPMSTFGPEMIEHFDGIGKQFAASAFERAANTLLARGYTFDFISDNQIRELKYENGQLITKGKSEYKTVVVPFCDFIPVETLQHLMSLVESGANVIMYRGVPSSFAGFADLENKEAEYRDQVSKFAERIMDENGVMTRSIGKGQIVIGDSLELTLNVADVNRETMTDDHLEFTRRSFGDGRMVYLIRNTGEPFDGWVTLNASDASMMLHDPMTGSAGNALQKDDGLIRLQLSGGQTVVVVAGSSDAGAPMFPYFSPAGAPVPLRSGWSVTFESGGPVLPGSFETDTLGSWTNYNSDDYREFSGTAVYKTQLSLPQGGKNGWILDLGDVRESARVILNGREIAAMISPPFRVKIEPSMAQAENVLEVRVTNLMANRIAALDKKGVKWKKFYNINFPARKEENRRDGLFDASNWHSRPSGLLGPVQLLLIENEAIE